MKNVPTYYVPYVFLEQRKPLPFFDFRRGMGMDLGSKLVKSWWGGTGI